jgi:probable selenium-dependent hydroxylase accessory protein YqeC
MLGGIAGRQFLAMRASRMETSPFSDQFAFDSPALVNFVGGGGKTSLILALISEYQGDSVALYTTTTRIHPPPVTNGLTLISGDNMNLLKLILARIGRHCFGQTGRFTVTGMPLSPGLLQGVPIDFCDSLDRDYFPLVLNEADGARSMSLKMPREGEPVLMSGASYLVPVIGLDCLNKPLGPQTLFRWDLAAPRYGLRQGDLLTAELAASLLMHRNGVCRDWNRGMTIIPYINKVDSDEDLPHARALARALTVNSNFPVEKVVLGTLKNKRVVSL